MVHRRLIQYVFLSLFLLAMARSLLMPMLVCFQLTANCVDVFGTILSYVLYDDDGDVMIFQYIVQRQDTISFSDTLFYKL